MSRKTLWGGAGAGLVLVALLVWAFAPRPLEVELAAVSVGPYEQSITEDGRTQLRDRYVVAAPLAGRLARISLREGDAVAAGDVVATLTPVLSPLVDERSQREQMSRVEAAQAAVQRAQASVQRARVGQEQARLELQRDEQLAKQNFIAPAKLDSDKLALQAAQRELELAIQSRHVSEHELQTMQEALTAVRKPGVAGANAFAIRSPVAGRVLRIPQPSETTVALGAPLMEIGNTQALEIVAELLTTDALQVRAGAPVRIERWGGAGDLDGRVRSVAPSAFTKVSALGVEEQRVNVWIDLTSPLERWQALGDGYRVGVRVVTLSKSSVLRVPVSAVFPQAAGGMALFVVRDGRAHLTPVVLGGRNGVHAWLQNGVEAGAKVIVYPPTALRDGARVAARRVGSTAPQ